MQISEIEDAISNNSSDITYKYKELCERLDDLERIVKALADKVNEVIAVINESEEKK